MGTISLIKSAIERERTFIKSCNESNQRDNPQVIKSRLLAEGRLDALEVVLAAARGNTVYLRILAGK
jgi:hypothetical protein